MTAAPLLVVFLGGMGGSRVEEMVREARTAATLDAIEAALSSRACAGAVLVTDDPSLERGIPGLEIDLQDGPFHFGARLAGLLRARSPARAVCMGGGSMPLLRSADYAALAADIAPDRAVTNNAFSSDLVAFPVTEPVLCAVQAVHRDNGLARALAELAGLQVRELPRTERTQMDIDSPTDLAVLSITGLGGPRLRACLQSTTIDVEPYERLLPLFLDTGAEILVAGRVGSHAWQYLERQTACRVRIFAEERGMEAEGRGRPRSLLGFYLEEAGLERFFPTLAQLGRAAVLDTRVLLAHMGIEATREDRFLSDLRLWRDIREPFLREFTRRAAEAPIPVLLGGHSLVSGGLMALNEFAWRRREAGELH